MMKNAMRASLLALVLGLSRPAAGAEPAALFNPEPPEPAMADLVETYLNLLARGAIEEALLLNDLRGMRQHLLERRLADLKARNPELTAKDLDEMSGQIQMGELHPARLRQIVTDLLQEAGYAGMTWRIRGYAPPPEGVDGYLASIETRTAAGRDRPVLLGLIKLGDEWRVSPAVLEKMMENRPVIRAGPGAPPPPDIMTRAHAFWEHFRLGTLNEAYQEMSPAYRERVPMLVFLQQAQDFIGKVGIPTAWSIVQGVETDPGVWFVGVNVQGSSGTRPTLMQFIRLGQTWVVEGVQFSPPRPPDPGTARPALPAGPAAPGRPDLRPDLRPVTTPAILLPTPAGAGEPAPPDRLRPDGPIGPDPL